MDGQTERTNEELAVSRLMEALELLKQAAPSRENSLAITKIEEALMWSNKDRTIKGQLQPYPTHVEGE